MDFVLDLLNSLCTASVGYESRASLFLKTPAHLGFYPLLFSNNFRSGMQEGTIEAKPQRQDGGGGAGEAGQPRRRRGGGGAEAELQRRSSGGGAAEAAGLWHRRWDSGGNLKQFTCYPLR